MTEVVYRSQHADVLAHWDATVAAVKAWPKRVEETLTDLGLPGKEPVRRGRQVIGVRHDPHEPVPAGWRRDSHDRFMIAPARRTRPGRQIGERLDALEYPDPMHEMPGGMPYIAMNAAWTRFLKAHRIHKVDGAVYVVWAADLEPGDASHIDPEVWERVKLSAYYAAVEAEQEAKAS